MTKITRYFKECFDFINSASLSGGRVYLHCMAGISRSAAIAIAYVMVKRSVGFDEAYALVKEKRPVSQPNSGFIQQVKEFKLDDLEQ